MRSFLAAIAVVFVVACSAGQVEGGPLAIATFQVDATPPLGYPLRYGYKSDGSPARKIVDPLSARGIVVLAGPHPIVLCAVDWLAIGNGGHEAWRHALADAAGTTMDRVAVHVLHQHDAPGCHWLMEETMSRLNFEEAVMDVAFTRDTIARVAEVVREAVKKPQRVTHVGLGKAKVDRVASNRRILGPDGKVKHGRMSRCRSQAIRDMPEGVIDPYVRLISFWDTDRPIASLTYYAVHGQSMYGQGAVSADFLGLARSLREATLPAVDHIHFNGAGGNLAVGKYNDGKPTRRLELANRVAEGMQAAWQSIKKVPVSSADVEWRVKPVALPAADDLDAKKLEAEYSELIATGRSRTKDWRRTVWELAWVRHCQSGNRIDVTCLRIGSACILHMPGELFVEYQLAAQEMRPDAFVCMAAFGDFGPGYIGTAIAYSQGGYETGDYSRVSPQVESVLMSAMRELLR